MSDGAEEEAAPDTRGPASPTDGALVLRARDGDVTAFECLVTRYQGRLFRVAYLAVRHRHDAEDLVQDTLLTAWRRLAALTDPAAFRPWLFQICTRRAADLQRRQAARRTDPIAPEDLPETGDERSRLAGRPTDPASSVVVDAQLRRLATLLSTLDPALRACWLLREIEQLSYAQIARALSLTESTVRGRLARARAEISSRMGEWR